MTMGAAHPRVLGYLGRALSLELTAVQQYMTQASLVALWGDVDAAERFRHETVEELRHAETLIQRMLALGVAPAASQLRPVSHGSDLTTLLQHNLRLEDELIQLYADAARFCGLIGDADNGELFGALLSDEQHHADALESWRRSLPSHADPYAAWVSERATF